MSAELVHLATRIHPTHGQTWAVFASWDGEMFRSSSNGSRFSGVLLPECTRDVVRAYLESRITRNDPHDIPALLSSGPMPDRDGNTDEWSYVARFDVQPGTSVLPLGASPAPAAVVAWESRVVALLDKYTTAGRGYTDWIDDTEERLNDLGADGWEHVATSDGFAYFKRLARKATP